MWRRTSSTSLAASTKRRRMNTCEPLSRVAWSSVAIRCEWEISVIALDKKTSEAQWKVNSSLPSFPPPGPYDGDDEFKEKIDTAHENSLT